MGMLTPAIFELRADATKFHSEMGRVSTSLDKMSKDGATAAEKLRAAAGPIAAAFGGIATVVAVALNSVVGDYDKATAELKTAMENAGQSTDEWAGRINDAVKANENLGFTAAQTKESIARLDTATGDMTKSLALLPVVADYATMKHMSLADASLALTRAMSGQGRALKDMGIDIKHVADGTQALADATTPAEKNAVRFAAAMDELSRKIHGQAAAAANTFSGELNVLKTKIIDVAAEAGGPLVKVLTVLGPLFTIVGASAMAAGTSIGVFAGSAVSALAPFVAIAGLAVADMYELKKLLDMSGIAAHENWVTVEELRQGIQDLDGAYGPLANSTHNATDSADAHSKAMQEVYNNFSDILKRSPEYAQAFIDQMKAHGASEEALGRLNQMLDAYKQQAADAQTASLNLAGDITTLADNTTAADKAFVKAADSLDHLAAAQKAERDGANALIDAHEAVVAILDGTTKSSGGAASATLTVAEALNEQAKKQQAVVDANEQYDVSSQAVADAQVHLAEMLHGVAAGSKAALDAQRALTDAQLSSESATLAVADAQDALAKAQADVAHPPAGVSHDKMLREVEKAQIALTLAQEAASDASKKAAAQQDTTNGTLNGFVGGSKEATDAQDALEKATNTLAKAQTAQFDALDNLTKKQAAAGGVAQTAAEKQKLLQDAYTKEADAAQALAKQSGDTAKQVYDDQITMSGGTINLADERRAMLEAQVGVLRTQAEMLTPGSPYRQALEETVTRWEKLLGSAWMQHGTELTSPNQHAGTGIVGYAAEGGPVTPGNWVVGENGPEVVHIGSAGNVIPNHALGGGSTYNITLTPPPYQNSVDMGRSIVEAIAAYERTNGKRWRMS